MAKMFPTTLRGRLLVLCLALLACLVAAGVARYGFGWGQNEPVASVNGDDEGTKDTAETKDGPKNKEATKDTPEKKDGPKDKETTKDTTEKKDGPKDKETTKDTTEKKDGPKDKEATKDTTGKKDAPKDKEVKKDAPKDKEVVKEPAKKLPAYDQLLADGDAKVKGKDRGRFTVPVPREVSDAEFDRACERYKNLGWMATKGSGSVPGERFLILQK